MALNSQLIHPPSWQATGTVRSGALQWPEAWDPVPAPTLSSRFTASKGNGAGGGGKSSPDPACTRISAKAGPPRTRQPGRPAPVCSRRLRVGGREGVEGTRVGARGTLKVSAPAPGHSNARTRGQAQQQTSRFCQFRLYGKRGAGGTPTVPVFQGSIGVGHPRTSPLGPSCPQGSRRGRRIRRTRQPAKAAARGPGGGPLPSPAPPAGPPGPQRKRDKRGRESAGKFPQPAGAGP